MGGRALDRVTADDDCDSCDTVCDRPDAEAWGDCARALESAQREADVDDVFKAIPFIGFSGRKPNERVRRRHSKALLGQGAAIVR